MREGEFVAAWVPVKEFDDTHFIISVTARGVINKQPLDAYNNVRRGGINAMNLDEGDSLIGCKLTNGDNDIILGTRSGLAVRFHESAARELGRNTRGVKGITLRNSDVVVGMIIVNDSEEVLTVTENGYGKRTVVSEYRKTNRGGTGIINIRTEGRNGPVVSLKPVSQGSGKDVMLISRNGIVIRVPADNISLVGRNTQGVRLMSLDEGDVVVDVALCDASDDPEVVLAEGAESAVVDGAVSEAGSVDSVSTDIVQGESQPESDGTPPETPPLEE
jgi:DNA gyrase subunit A